MPFKKYFTVEEANQFIPQLLELMPQVQKMSAVLSKNFPDVKNAWKNARYDGGSTEGTLYLTVALELNKLLKALTQKGIVLKGMSEGLVDFPALREGKEVYLCWKNPEKEIQYWHDLDSGYAGRQRL